MPGLLIALMAAALGGDPAAAPAPPAQAAPAKDPLVCTFEAEKDSHFKKRVCMTKSERAARSALERNNLMSSQRPFCSGKDC